MKYYYLTLDLYKYTNRLFERELKLFSNKKKQQHLNFKMKSCYIALILFLSNYSIDFTNAQCTLTCLHNGKVDLKVCACQCDPAYSGPRCETPNFTCEKLPSPDLEECDYIPCTSDVAEYFCPKKCYCERPSVVTNMCPPCLNDGVLDTKSCKCTCKNKYMGARCQFSQNPCAEEDSLECSAINCWEASEAKFFRCQKKCLCCGNKECYNYGLLVTDATSASVNNCKCKCATTFDPETDCKETIGDCKDEIEGCEVQFGKSNCFISFIESICPKMCGKC
jgi:hypothetical protein